MHSIPKSGSSLGLKHGHRPVFHVIALTADAIWASEEFWCFEEEIKGVCRTEREKGLKERAIKNKRPK